MALHPNVPTMRRVAALLLLGTTTTPAVPAPGPIRGVVVSSADKAWLANLTHTIVSNGQIPTVYNGHDVLLFSPDDCTLYPNGTVVQPAGCAWDPLDGCKAGTPCYADSYTRDSTYGITFAPEFYEKAAVRAAVDTFLNTSRGGKASELGLQVTEAILPTGSLSFGCPDNNAFMLKLAAFYATQWDDHEWLCAHEMELAAVYTWARRLRGPSGLSSGQ
jgi:hypothetical protein